MTVFEKKPLERAGMTKKVRFDGFAIDLRGEVGAENGGRLTACESKNCEINDGVLTTGVGILPFRLAGEELPMSGEIPQTDFFFFLPQKQDDGTYTQTLGCVSLDGEAHVYDADEFQWKKLFSFGSRTATVAAINGEGEIYTVFACTDDLFTYDRVEGLVPAVGLEHETNIVCVFKNRVFCVLEPFTVAYSSALVPWDYNESIDDGGRISFPSEGGKIVALVPFDEAVYVFYEYGVSRIDMAGRARDFSLKRIGYNGGRIFGDTVGVCSVGGEKVFFLAEDGLYRFDGNTAERICENLAIKPLRDTHVCAHGVSDGKYFVQYVDKNGTKRAVAVDAEREEGYYFFTTEGLSSDGGKAFCRYEAMPHCLQTRGALPSGEEYVFEAAGLRFGLAGRKALKGLSFEGEGAMRVKVDDGRRWREVRLSFSNGRADWRLRMRGEAFRVRLTLEKGAIVRSMTAEVEVCKR